jgi:hypothetical protein
MHYPRVNAPENKRKTGYFSLDWQCFQGVDHSQPSAHILPASSYSGFHEAAHHSARFCMSDHGMPGATAVNEADKILAFLGAIVNADDATTVGDIWAFIDDMDAVRCNHNKINRLLNKLDLVSPALEPEVLLLDRHR